MLLLDPRFFLSFFIWLHRVLVAACGLLVAACGLLVAACGLLAAACEPLVGACGI